MDGINPEVLSRYLSGDITAEESAMVERWMTENQLTKEQLRDLIYPAEGVRFMMELDPEKDWKSVRKKIIHRNTSVFQRLRVAASLSFLILVGIFAYRVFVPQTIAYKSITNNKPEVSTVNLPDGSVLYLNEGAGIRYVENFQEDRRIELKGEAFFDVKRDENYPFEITAGACTVKVLGTSFSVDADSSQVMVLVKSGKVLLQSPSQNAIYLNENDAGFYGAEIDLLTKTTADNPNRFAWQTRKLVFQESRFEDVINDLEKYFNVVITVNGKKDIVPGYTSEFDNPRLNDVLDEMKLVLPVTYSIDNKNVLISIISQ